MDYGYLDMIDIIIFEFLEGASLMFQFQIRTQFSLPQSTETNNKNNVFMQIYVDSENLQKKLLASSTSDYFEALSQLGP